MANNNRKSEEKANEKLTALRALRDRVRAAAKSPDVDFAEAQAGDLVNTHPLLHSALFAQFIDDDLEEGASLIIWGKEDGLGALLNMKPFNGKAFFNAGSLQELLDALEAALGDPDFKWSRDRRSKSRSRNRGRRKH